MELTECYVCECNEKNYGTRQSLNQHKKTKGHIQWVNNRELRELKCELTKKDNKIIELESANHNLQELNFYLVKKLHDKN